MIHRLPKGFSHPVQIGMGGYGTVYRARQDALDRLVALKFIVEKNAAARAVLIKEASMQAGLHIRGIPQVYDVKEISGSVCLVMQWINGCCLRTVLDKNIDPEYKLCIAAEIIGITAALHERGYAHRDIKPENILISSEGVFLIDFGLALHVVTDERQTQADVVKGTPAYIAPELLKGQGREADLKRADVYSMGRVIRELAGDDPLPGCIDACLRDAPGARLPSAVEALRQWETSVPAVTIRWSDIAEPCAGQALSRQLYEAAVALVGLRRMAEAYDLLVECLQTSPDLPEALDLMVGFPVIRKRKSAIARRFVVAAALLIIGGLGAMFALSKKPIIDNGVTVTGPAYGRSLFLSSARAGSTVNGTAFPFKDTTGPFETLDGRLIVVDHPEKGALFIDGKQMHDFSGTFRLSALNCEHSIMWRVGNGAIAWKEVITSLPFETKRISIRER